MLQDLLDWIYYKSSLKIVYAFVAQEPLRNQINLKENTENKPNLIKLDDHSYKYHH